MLRKLVTVALLAAGCKSEAAPPREAPKTTAPQPEADEVEQARAAAAAATEEAQRAYDTVQRVQGELEALDKRVIAAAEELSAMQTDADRTAAAAKLDQLRAEQAALKVKRRNALAQPRGARAPAPAPAPPQPLRPAETKPTP